MSTGELVESQSLQPATDRSATAGTVKAFRLLGVPIRLHFTFILLLVFIIIKDLGSRQPSGSYSLFVLGILLSVLLHELGHALMAAHFNIRTVEVVMFPIGGLSRMQRSLRPSEEFWVSLTGPVVNLVLSGGLFGYMAATHQA